MSRKKGDPGYEERRARRREAGNKRGVASDEEALAPVIDDRAMQRRALAPDERLPVVWRWDGLPVALPLNVLAARA
jgi:hypothetical protein